MHMPGLPDQRCVQGEEDMVLVAMHRRGVIAASARVDDQRMQTEDMAQCGLSLFVPAGNVDPDEAAATVQQSRQILRQSVLYTGRSDEPNIHTTSVMFRTAKVHHPTPSAGGQL